MSNNIHKIKSISFFGGAEVSPESKQYRDVFLSAQTVAKHGYQVVDGGGPGVMQAATEGAESVGGDTLAVSLNSQYAPGFEGSYLANQADQQITTTDYSKRVHHLVANADCFIVFNGGTGTISELGMIWCLARLYYPYHKPFILFGSFWHDVVATFNRNMLIRPDDDKVFQIISSPELIIPTIESFDRHAANLRRPKVKSNSPEKDYMS